MPEPLDPAIYRDLVRRALAEDLGAGDITTSAIVPPDLRGHGTIASKSTCVVAGLDVVREVLAQVDRSIEVVCLKKDGELCRPGEALARLTGPAASLLTAERTAINFLQHLSGIATLTRRFVDAGGGAVTILDTRKTVPTLRALAKYAVRCGGGTNHRKSLDEAVLIKDNHIRLAGSVAEAVRRVRAAGLTGPIEVEAQSSDEVDAAVAAGADIVMLDNLDDVTIRQAVARIAGRARIEVSGGMSLDRVRVLSSIGVDTVSVGALTHSAPAADISFEIE